MLEEVLKFWFKEVTPRQWWISDPSFDTLLRQRFSHLLHLAAAGELFSWRSTATGRLAEILVLDQFSRHIYRDTPKAFTQDPVALVLSQEAVSAGALSELDAQECAFVLMPYMHSESRVIHAEATPLFQQFTSPKHCQFELQHKAIIDRFGRYPHRNRILGRASTEEEAAFLKQPESSF